MIKTSNKDHKIPLLEIVENIEMQSDEVVYYFDKAENKFVFVMNGYELEENEALQNEIENNRDNFVPLPSTNEINEYEMIKAFSNNQTNEVKESLLNTLQGKGVFRKFKDKVFDLNIRDEWFAFKEQELVYIATDWIEEHNLGRVFSHTHQFNKK